MANISSSLTGYLFGLLTSDEGIDSQLQLIAQDDGVSFTGDVRSVSVQNTAPDLAERSLQVQYPALYLYCEKLTNSLKEKFRTFSGKARLVIEVRCSQDRLEGLERKLERYADAACRVLDGARGSWQDGAFYAGGYEVVYGTVRQGGKNFLQTAKISFDVEVSK
jgi:hypothetical protein